MLRNFTPGHPVLQWVINLGLAIGVVSAVAFFSYTIFTNKSNELHPRIIVSVSLEPTVLLPGRSFDVHIETVINAICPGEVHWALIRKADNVEIFSSLTSTQPSHLGKNNEIIPRLIPPAIEPGEYFYVATVYDYCGPNRTTYVAVTKRIPFTVR